jgi:hypothetical protein
MKNSRLIVVGTVSSLCFSLGALSQTRKPAAGPPPAPTRYGALAVDRSQGYVYAWAYDQPSRAAATAYAQEECRKRNGNCKVVIEFSGPGCAAYQTVGQKDGSAYGWGTAPAQGDAQSRALGECTKFANGKAVCSNSVWACNSGPGLYKALYVEPVMRAPAATDCLVQYEAQVYYGSNWASRFYSPLYRLAAADCPLSGKSMYHGFGYNEHPGEAPRAYEVNEDRKGPAKQQLGYNWAKTFYQWTRRGSPFSGMRIYTNASFTVADATPENVTKLTEQTAKRDAGDQAGITEGWCIDYRPQGVTPVATLGADRCKRWWR